MNASSKTAVILFNLGGPDSRAAIKPFLFNFFMDKNIIGAPEPVRWLLAKYISEKRGSGAALESYAYLDYCSPLLRNTEEQASALKQILGDDYEVFISMRYWYPLAEETAAKVREYGPDKIILLPLYPQYSTATTKSSFESWEKAAAACNLTGIPTYAIGCYPTAPGFVKASADNIKKSYRALTARKDNNGPAPRLLFSAHGLPESTVKGGDPYQWQCEQSAKAIAENLISDGLTALDWSICYQSRVGPKKWIGPSTEEALEKAAADKVPVLIYPVAFTQEHVETLVEIEIEYRELAEQQQIPAFERAPTVGAHPAFIAGLADLIKAREQEQDQGLDVKAGCATQCPAGFNKCGCRKS